MQPFKKPLIVTGITLLAALILGFGGSTWIYYSDASHREKTERSALLGTGVGIVSLMVIAPFWFFAAAKVGEARRHARQARKSKSS